MAVEKSSKIDTLWQYVIEEDYVLAEKLSLTLIKTKKYSPEATYVLGLVKYSVNDFTEALKYLNSALTLDTNNERHGHIHYWMGRTLSFNDISAKKPNPVFDKEAAVKAFEKAATYENYPVDTISRLVLLESTPWKKIQWYEKGIKKFPNEVEFYVYESIIHKNENSPIKQLNILLQGLKNNGASTSILFLLSQYHYNLGQFQESLNYILKAIENNDNPESWDCIYYFAGSISYALRQWKEALEYFEKSIQNSLNSSRIWYGVCGLIATIQKNKARIIIESYFTKPLLDKSIFAYIHLDFGIIAHLDADVIVQCDFLQERGDLLPFLTQVHKESNDTDFKIRSAIVLAALCEQFDLPVERLEYLRYALTRSDEVSYLSAILAEAYEILTDKDVDLKPIIPQFYKDSKKILSEKQTASILTVFIKHLYKHKKYDEIVELCSNIDDDGLNQADVLFEYAYALAELKRSVEAKHLYERCLIAHPNSAAAKNNLAIILRENKQFDEAIVLLKEAAKIDPSKELFKKNIEKTFELQQKKIQTDKASQIPANWTQGMTSITVEQLEEIEFFDILNRISKVNNKYREVLRRDWQELVFNYYVKNYKSIVVLSGSLVELLLTYYCEKRKIMKLTITNSKGHAKSKNLYDCVLMDLVSYVHDQNLFGADFNHLGNLARIYRNFIHPGLEMKSDMKIKSKANLCFIVVKEIIDKIL